MSSSEPRTRPDAGAVRTVPSALFVTTVPITLEAFLLPFADHFRAQGWRVDALANGATSNPHLDGHFGERFDVAWSRNLSLIHISEPTRLGMISYAVFCLK